MELPLPVYRQTPFKGDLGWSLDIKSLSTGLAAELGFVTIQRKEGS